LRFSLARPRQGRGEVVDQDGELAAEPGEQVARAQRCCEPFADLGQQPVAFSGGPRCR
jgi:hypothetical protein